MARTYKRDRLGRFAPTGAAARAAGQRTNAAHYREGAQVATAGARRVARRTSDNPAAKRFQAAQERQHIKTANTARVMRRNEATAAASARRRGAKASTGYVPAGSIANRRRSIANRQHGVGYKGG